MNVEISNQYEGGQFVGTNATYRLQGDFRKNPTSGKVTSFNGSVNLASSQSEESYIGSVSAYMNGNVLKYNLNDIAIEHLAGVVTAIGELISELEPSE